MRTSWLFSSGSIRSLPGYEYFKDVQINGQRLRGERVGEKTQKESESVGEKYRTMKKGKTKIAFILVLANKNQRSILCKAI